MLLGKKQIEKAGGKLIETDFRKLDKTDFDYGYGYMTKADFLAEPGAVRVDGVLFINTRIKSWEYLSCIYESLIQESGDTLREMEKMLKIKYPSIRSFKDWQKMNADDRRKQEVLIMLCIPTEFKRRKIEANYYGIRK